MPTPADHYADAERLLRTAIGNFPGAPILTDLVAAAQVHATLATVHPALLPRSVPEGCTCPRVASQPLARTATDPGCPIHGESP